MGLSSTHTMTRGPFLESPETFLAHFRWHNFLWIFKTKASQGTKLHGYCSFYLLYNIWKDQLCRKGELEFCEWLFGPEKFSRNGSEDLVGLTALLLEQCLHRHYGGEGFSPVKVVLSLLLKYHLIWLISQRQETGWWHWNKIILKSGFWTYQHQNLKTYVNK